MYSKSLSESNCSVSVYRMHSSPKPLKYQINLLRLLYLINDPGAPKNAYCSKLIKTLKLPFLREYKAERESMYWQLGRPLTLDDLVFTSVHFTPIEPAVLSRKFRIIVKKCGLGKVRFHDLRHTFASLMLLKGVNPKIVSEALGHASVGFTLNVYSHIIGNMQ